MADPNTTILIICSDNNTRRWSSCVCENADFRVLEASDGRRGLEIAKRAAPAPDVVLLDKSLPDISGEEILQRLKHIDRHLPVVVLTAHGSIRGALNAGRMGAFEYLTKPFQTEELVAVVNRALVQRRAARAGRDGGLRAALSAQMGASAAVGRLIEQVETVVASDYSVLLIGETGTGKELVARALHEHGPRHNKPFVAVDCGALVDTLVDSEFFGHERGAFTGAVERRRGRFELASGGTLLLDEIGNLSSAAQRSLLRALETRLVTRVGGAAAIPIDLRIVAATNEPVAERAQSGSFRRDLYFRLAEYTIVLPPLRSRPEDIEAIARRFLAEAASTLSKPPPDIAPSALALLAGYDWPGNVRELRNVMRRAALTAHETVSAADIAGSFSEGPSAGIPLDPDPGRGLLSRRLNERIRAVEREAILDALAQAGGNKAAAARLFGIDYKTFRTKLKAFAGAGGATNGAGGATNGAGGGRAAHARSH